MFRKIYSTNEYYRKKAETESVEEKKKNRQNDVRLLKLLLRVLAEYFFIVPAWKQT